MVWDDSRVIWENSLGLVHIKGFFILCNCDRYELNTRILRPCYFISHKSIYFPKITGFSGHFLSGIEENCLKWSLCNRKMFLGQCWKTQIYLCAGIWKNCKNINFLGRMTPKNSGNAPKNIEKRWFSIWAWAAEISY